jgi:hypothetical protein
VAALGAVLASQVGSRIATGLVDAGIDPVASGVAGGGVPQIAQLPGPVRIIVEQAYGSGVAELFLVAAPIALIATIAAIFLPNAVLGTKNAVQQQAELAAAAPTPVLAMSRS